MQEIWKDIDTYNGLYQISNFGRVRNAKGLIMSQKPSKDGYVRIQLFNNHKYKAEYVHILVAKHFVKKPSGEKLEVNHIDGHKANNVFTNLEWVTRSQNTIHAIHHNLRFVNPAKGKFGKDNPNSKPAAQYSFDGNLIKIWDSREDAAKELGCRRGDICGAINGWAKSCQGFMWRDAPNGNAPKIIEKYS